VAPAPARAWSNTIAELGDDDLHLVVSFIDALVTKTRLKALAGEPPDPQPAWRSSGIS